MMAAKEKKNLGGRPKRFEGKFSFISIQMPQELAERFAAASKAMGLSKSRFGQYLFEKWLKDNALGEKSDIE